MSGQFMIYGATGYTGKLAARRAKERGLCPVLGGRSEEKLRLIAEPLAYEYRVAPLERMEQLIEALNDIDVVLNMAGPFSETALPLADACLRTGTHYLDITGEIAVFEALYQRDSEASSRRMMLMPGVGFAVVPSDCLAAHVANRFPQAQQIRIGISRTSHVSRGSVKTLLELVSDNVKIRHGGVLMTIPLGILERRFDYGGGETPSTAVSWGDVFTAFHTTGIPNIESYVEVNPTERGILWAGGSFAWILHKAPWQNLLKIPAALLPEGPSGEELATIERVIVAEAEDNSGRQARSRLRTPDGYTFTAMAALAVVERVLAGEFRIGFQTPARVYGPDFVLNFKGVFLEDLDA